MYKYLYINMYIYIYLCVYIYIYIYMDVRACPNHWAKGPWEHAKAFSDSRLSFEWRIKHESEKVPAKAGPNHWSHRRHTQFLFWGRVLSTEPKAHEITQELTDQLLSACSQGPLAQWLRHALTNVNSREAWDRYGAFSSKTIIQQRKQISSVKGVVNSQSPLTTQKFPRPRG